MMIYVGIVAFIEIALWNIYMKFCAVWRNACTDGGD